MKRIQLLASAALVVGSVALAHPHLEKTVTAKLPAGSEVRISYSTEPTNEAHTAKAAVGSFLHAGALVTFSTVVTGAVNIPAGEFTVGAIKNGDGDFTMGLYPGRLRLSDTPDPAKMIKLESLFSNAMGSTHHLLVDIEPGHGKLEGKTVLTLHFGSLYLAGALS